MRRRNFIAGLASTTAAWPLAAGAQSVALPIVGFLDSRSPELVTNRLSGFRQGLKEAGYAEGENVAIEYRWAEDDLHRLPALAADLVHRQVAVIVAGGPPSTFAAKAATATIPTIFLEPISKLLTAVDPI
jgi:ABC-type uncharacterized transport system substrate-binding protein